MNNTICNTPAPTRRQRMTSGLMLCALALLMPGLAGAAGWEIDPVRVELIPGHQTAAITIKNASDLATSIQIQTVTWSQTDGKDVYAPTKDVLVSPPIVTIPANGEQVIRVALRRPADTLSELSYRINLQEVIPQPATGFSGVQVALRIGLPVFVQSKAGDAAPKLVWKLQRMSGNTLKVALENKGNAHIQIADFALYAPGSSQALASEASSSYVLAGQGHEWLLKTSGMESLSGDHLLIKGFTDGDNLDTELVLDKP